MLSSIQGRVDGIVAVIAGINLTNVIYQTKYKKWLKENAGKHIVNRYGKLERIPFAFITSPQITFSTPGRTPYFTVIFTLSIFTFVISYKRVKFSILKNSNDNTHGHLTAK